MKAVVRWTIFTILMIACFRLVWWNEHESPWGLATQAAKIETLKAQLCK